MTARAPAQPHTPEDHGPLPGDGRTGRTGRRSLLAHRDFRLLWIGQTTSKLGTSVTSVAVPFVAVATLDASTFQGC